MPSPFLLLICGQLLGQTSRWFEAELTADRNIQACIFWSWCRCNLLQQPLQPTSFLLLPCCSRLEL